MHNHRYGRDFRGGYAGDYGRPYRGGPPPGGYGYDAAFRARHEPALPRRPMFIPFGWDGMMRWSGWDSGMGLVPMSPDPLAYGRGGYGPGGDDRGFRERPRGYGRDLRGGPRPVPPRQSPTWGRGGDDAVREWARGHGYGVEYTIEPRPRRR